MDAKKCKGDGCGKPIFAQADGSWKHEQRTKTDGYTGAERRKSAAPPTPPPQPSPSREHLLHRVLVGAKKAVK